MPSTHDQPPQPPVVDVKAREPIPGRQEQTWEWNNFVDPEGETAAEKSADAARLKAGMDYLIEKSSVAKFISTPELIRDIATEVEDHGEIRPDDSPMVTAGELGALRDSTIAWAVENGLFPENDYHNRKHVEGTVNRVLALAIEFNAGPQERKISRAEAEGLMLAAVVHDTGHNGVAKRVSDKDNLTAEQNAADLADAEARKRGYSVHVRQLMARAILSTSFWEHTTNADIKPQTVIERVFQQGDIGGYVFEPEFLPEDQQFDQQVPIDGKSIGEQESNSQWLKESFQVSSEWARNKVVRAPDSISKWLKGQHGFTFYLRMQHDILVREALPHYIVEDDGEDIVVNPDWIWEQRLQEKIKLVEAMMSHFDGETESDAGIATLYAEEIAYIESQFDELQVLQRQVDAAIAQEG